MMKQIFRNLKNDNKNKNDTQDLRGNLMREKTTDGDEDTHSTIWAGRVQNDHNHNKWFDLIAELQPLL